MKLKELRVKAGYTQQGIALALGIKQPTYQRWEATGEVPKGRLDELARLFSVNANVLPGGREHQKISYGANDQDQNSSYFGEVSIHFTGGGEPVVFSISVSEVRLINAHIIDLLPYIVFRTLANQTVVVRSQAISDLYFADDALDAYGPESVYENHLNILMPDPMDWSIAEAMLGEDEDALDEFEESDIKRVELLLNNVYDISELALNGMEPFEKPIDPKSKNDQEAIEQRKHRQQMLFEAVKHIQYQLSNGNKRSVEFTDEVALFENLFSLIECHQEYEVEQMIRIPLEGNYSVAFINPSAFDYFVIPTHRLDRAAEALSKIMD